MLQYLPWDILLFIYFFGFVFFGATSGNAQKLVLALHQGLLLAVFQGPDEMPGLKHGSAVCKASVLFIVLSV